MVRLETTLLDKMVSGMALGKRQLGRPLKYNIRAPRESAMMDLIYNPRNQFEQFLSKAWRLSFPYLATLTYKGHVEGAREGGFRIDDIYSPIKFWKDPYIQLHLFTQYFHPHTYHERMRQVTFWRRPSTLFKGYSVPDWAQMQNREGSGELDMYSRKIWREALNDLNAEWTPMPWEGQRLDPNLINWFRFESWGNGMSSKLFYNEVPNPNYYKHGGHLDDPDKTLYSFNHANQEKQFVFGMDTRTPEGRAAFQEEFEAVRTVAPELVKDAEIVFPHEIKPRLNSEPHFRRVWGKYRNHALECFFRNQVDAGHLSESELEAASNFSKATGLHVLSIYALGQHSKAASHFANDEGYQAINKMFGEIMCFNDFNLNTETSRPVEDQLWDAVDHLLELTEESLNKNLATIVTDPR